MCSVVVSSVVQLSGLTVQKEFSVCGLYGNASASLGEHTPGVGAGETAYSAAVWTRFVALPERWPLEF
jgi:hypothetical protein